MFTAFWGEQQAAVGNRRGGLYPFGLIGFSPGERLCLRLKIRWKSDGDNRGWCVTWSDVENQGLVLFLCALDVEDHFKGDSGASRFRFASGDGGDPKHVPQATFSVFMGVLPRDCLNLGHEVACYGRREAETGLQSGWSNVN